MSVSLQYAVICEYTGASHADPLKEFVPILSIGPFLTSEAAHKYERTARYDNCKKHHIVPFIGPHGMYVE